MPEKPFNCLALGDNVYEIDPWCGIVHTRIIDTMIETAVMRLGAISRTIAFRINGPLTHDNSFSERDWGTKFFPDRQSAHRVLAERTLALKAERRANLERDMESIRKQLEETDAK